MSKENKGVKKVSFFNWLVSLIFSIIPGLNIVFFILTGLFARNPSKRTYAAAALTLTLIVMITITVFLIFFGSELVEWAEQVIKEAPAATPVEALVP